MKYEMLSQNSGCLYLKKNTIPFYINTNGTWTLMDSGTKYDSNELMSFFREKQITISDILTSHVHYDHIGNHQLLHSEYGSRRIMSQFDAGVVQSPTSLQACFYSTTSTEIEKYLNEMICGADRILEKYQSSVVVEDLPFRVLCLAGHAASHLGFETPDGMIYLGDSLICRKARMNHPLIYMLDWKTELETVSRIGNLKSICVASHGGIIEDIEEECSAFVDDFLEKVCRIRQVVTDTMTIDQIVEKAITVFRIEIYTLGKAKVTERMVRSYINYLVETEQLECGIAGGLVLYSPV